MRKIVFLIFIVILVFAAGCDVTSSNATFANNATTNVKKGVAPVADTEIAVIEMETPAFGTIKLELYSNIAPMMVARFKELAKRGAYDGTIFHRINQSVIQGGDLSTSEAKPSTNGGGPPKRPNLDAEFSDLQYETGIVGAARHEDINSANSQFFVTLRREQGFDNRYTIFGKVIEGMNNVMTISGVQPKNGERPVEPVRIKHISIVQR